MGISFSSRKDIYLHRFSNPSIKECVCQTMVRMVYNDGNALELCGDNPFANIVSMVDENQKIVIQGVYLLFVNNEFKKDLEISISHLFDLPAHKNEDIHHPDDTASVKIICPQSFNGSIDGNDRVIYKPKLRDELIRKYAGLEQAILEPQSIQMPGPTENEVKEVFEETSAIMGFIFDNTAHLKPSSSDVKKLGECYYEIDGEFLERVRTFFKNTIFDDIRYTRFEDCRIDCKAKGTPGMSVSVIVQLNYLLILSGDSKMKQDEIKL